MFVLQHINKSNPYYLFNLTPVTHSLYTTRNVSNLPLFNTKHSFLKHSFFQSTIIERNKLDINFCTSRSLFIFKKHILQFIWPSSNSEYNFYDPKGINLWLDFVWVESFNVSINLDSVFKIRLILYVTVITKLNPQFIFSSTALCSQMKKSLSLALYAI